MNDEAQKHDDENRPLSGAERLALRKLLRVVEEEDKVAALERLIGKADVLTDISSAVEHMNWLQKLAYRVSIWLAAIVGGVIAWPSLKTLLGIK